MRSEGGEAVTGPPAICQQGQPTVAWGDTPEPLTQPCAAWMETPQALYTQHYAHQPPASSH
eukprot:9221981-Alexandrium_andersonii.AAC.1